MDDELKTETPTRTLYGKVCDDLTSRQQWETRQETWYKMRHGGIGRRKKPWPHAPDMHYPLGDGTIDELKPFYFNQLFGTEVIAQFSAKDPAVAAYSQEVGYWYDFKLKQKTNLERETLRGIDRMLMAGHVPIRVGWDAFKNQLFFDAVEPAHCIVPDSTEEMRDADRITFVHHLSPDQYRRDKRYTRKDADFIKRITGKGGEEKSGDNGLRQSKEIREGITHGSKGSDVVIIWEIWDHLPEGGWELHFISPMEPDEPVRPSQKNPFNKVGCPCVRFDMEIKDKGHYSSRGIMEMMYPFEQSLNKTWNSKLEAMELHNTPRFSSKFPIPNAGNLRLIPGSIHPGLEAVQSPNRPPISFDEEMHSTREVAERRVGVPDYGIGSANDKNSPRTATEVNRIGQQQGVGVELRARTFRMALAELLQIAWAILLQHDKDTQYYVAAEAKKLPEDVLRTDAWMVEPSGSSESWNKGAQMQRAAVRYQMFGPSQGFPQGHPNVNQGELAKSVMEIDDPRLVGRLFIETNARGQMEYEDEMEKVPAILLGAPFQPRPEQDQAPRIMAIMDFIAAQDAKGTVLAPDQMAALQQRANGNMQLLQKKNPQQAAQLQQQLAAKAQNVIQMPPESRPDSLPASAAVGAAP